MSNCNENSKNYCTTNRGCTGARGVKGDTGPKGFQGIQGIQGLQGDPGVDGVDGPILDNFGDVYREYNSSIIADFGAAVGITNYPINLNSDNIIYTATDNNIAHDVGTSLPNIVLQSGYYLVSYSITIGSTSIQGPTLYSFALYLNGIYVGSQQAEEFSSTTQAQNISDTVIVTVDTTSNLNVVVVNPGADPNTLFSVKGATVTVTRLGDYIPGP